MRTSTGRKIPHPSLRLLSLVAGLAAMAVAGHPTAVAQTALEAAAEQAEQEVMRRARAAARRESAEPAPPSVPQTARVRPAEPPSRPPSAGANGQQVTPAPGPRPAPGEPPPTKSQTGALQSVTISPEVFDQVWRRAFARPETPPSPAANSLSEAKVALGARLFSDKRLSSDHKSSCATCHDPARGFVDGRPRAVGKRGQTLARNTPPLWNLAWARKFGWDGSITTLEAVVKAQIERDDSMDATLEAGALWASRDASYAPAFARAFPERPQPTPQAVADALASYVRSVVSPQSRFDRWLAGDDRALAPEERAGFEEFSPEKDNACPATPDGVSPTTACTRRAAAPSGHRRCARWLGRHLTAWMEQLRHWPASCSVIGALRR